MELSELLEHLSRTLDSLGLQYFVTGSMATIFYGDPRFTNDIDVVVDLTAQKISDFCRCFPEHDFYVSEQAVDGHAG